MFPFPIEGSEPPGIYPVTRVYFYFVSIWVTNCPTPCPEETKLSLLPCDVSSAVAHAIFEFNCFWNGTPQGLLAIVAAGSILLRRLASLKVLIF